jgi:hypothetical protein
LVCKVRPVAERKLGMESIELTELEMAEIAARHGTVNDFGKTFFTDSELFDFVVEVMGENAKRCRNIVMAYPLKSSN